MSVGVLFLSCRVQYCTVQSVQLLTGAGGFLAVDEIQGSRQTCRANFIVLLLSSSTFLWRTAVDSEPLFIALEHGFDSHIDDFF